MTPPPIEPINDFILIDRVPPHSTTLRGIYLPQYSRESSHRGTVVAIGRGRRREDGQYYPHTVKCGDHVIYESYAGEPVRLTYSHEFSDELFLVHEEHIIAVVED